MQTVPTMSQAGKKQTFAGIGQSTRALPLFGASEGVGLTPDNIMGTGLMEEVGVVTTDVATAVVSTTVEVDVVTTGQVIVGVVTTVASVTVGTGAAMAVAFIIFTVAVGVAGEEVVQVLIPGVAEAPVTVIARGEEAGSLAFVWLGTVTVDAATLVLSTVTGEVVMAVVTPGESVH